MAWQRILVERKESSRQHVVCGASRPDDERKASVCVDRHEEGKSKEENESIDDDLQVHPPTGRFSPSAIYTIRKKPFEPCFKLRPHSMISLKASWA